MLHSLKSQSPIKDDLNLYNKKTSCDKTSEESGMLTHLTSKCTQLSTQFQTNSSRFTKKNSNFKSKLAIKIGIQTNLKKSFKRKEESFPVLSNKKSKCEYKLNDKLINLQPKRYNDRQCKVCSRGFSTAAQLREHTLNQCDKILMPKCYVCKHDVCTCEEESSVVSNSKKSKCESEVNKALKLPVKRQSCFKSIYYNDKGNYLCKFCCRSFSTIGQLKEHTITHDNDSLVCYICNHEAASFSSLMTHVVKHSQKLDKGEIVDSEISTSEKSVNSLQCNQCKLNFTTFQKLANHNCPHVTFEKSEYMCAYCGRISTSVEEYRAHVQSHSVTPFMCFHCKLKLPTKKHLDRHNETCKKRPKLNFKCKKCAFECKGKRELNQHVKECESKKNISVFDCSSCKLSFSVKSDLDVHILNCKISVSSPNKDSESNYQNEKRKIKKMSNLCEVCGKSFNSKVGYVQHKEKCVQEKFEELEESSVLCSACGIQVDSLLLEEHTKLCCSTNKTEAKIKSPNRYSHCDLSPTKISGGEESSNARRSARLVGKKVVFSSEEDIKVKETDIRKQIKKLKVVNKFRSRKGRQSKLGKDNFMCSECSLTFCSKSTLLRHKRMHSGNPWYSCKYCGKYFFRKDVFNRHEMNVHSKSNKDIFCCYYCKLFFNATILLKEHVATVHKENSLQIKSGDSLNLDDIDPQIHVKQEQDSHIFEPDNVDQIKGKESQCVSESSSKMLNFPSLTKKCGICLKTFVTLSEIENHLSTHPIPISNDRQSPNKDVPVSLEINLKNVFSDNQIPSKTNDKCNGVVKDAKLLLTENVTSPSELPPSTTDDISVEEMIESSSNNLRKEEYACKLCFKVFTSKLALSKHQSEQHVIIDWYQCLVCDACGPKKDMVEHMFTHMYQVGTFVVANNDFNNVLTCLQQSENEVQRQKKQATGSEIDLNDSQHRETEFEDIDIELPKLTYHGNLGLEIEDPVNNEPLMNCSINQENTIIETSSIETSTDKGLKECVCIESESFNEVSSTKNNLVQEIPSVSISDALHNASDKNLSDKDPFQELRRILKADNIPLKEISMSSDVSNKSDICNKTSIEENSSDAQNYSQLRYLLEKNVRSKVCEKETPIDQYIECTNELDAFKESNENSDAVTSMRNLIQDLKSLNKLVSENVSNSDLIEEVNFNNLNEGDKVSATKSNEALNVNVTNLNENFKFSNKEINEIDKLSVKLLTDVDKVNNRIESDGIAEEENKTLEFNFKSNTELDKNSFKSGREGIKFSSKSNNESDKNIFKNKNEANKFIFKSNNELDIMILKHMNESDMFNSQNDNSADKFTSKSETKAENLHCHLNLNQVHNTCLKFDVNQSRGEFSERSSSSIYHQNSTEFQKTDKMNNLFQPTNPQSTILDFSDLLKISDSANPNESNIFEISSQSSELCDISDNLASTSSGLSKKSSIELTYSTECAGTSVSKEEIKCNKCDIKCKSYADLFKHQCVKPVSFFEQISSATSKTKPLPFNFSRTTLDNSSDLVKKKQNALENSKHISNTIYICCVCSKIVKTSSLLEQHYRAEHSGYSNNSFPNNKCILCYQVLYGIADFMKHSLNCLKSNNGTNLDESSKNKGLLQSLLLKPNSQAQERSLAPSNISQENDIASFRYDNILNLSRNPFNS